ncbi:uncharacterized protein LOC105161370 [Sesamum indicum]|uniref:Uncharacterized protein LOC105161370 n=1 Tax=Sesamum indicum TaxID=4182 RepID=A0A6I9T1L2_SESIN|nr:uncharacterized protein LOC105161370 [Sesamum indicum]
MAESDKETEHSLTTTTTTNRSFGSKCSHLAKKQRAKFYIVRRCIAMLVCWHERKEPKD